LDAGLEVPESGVDLEVVVDGVAAALAECLSVFESGGDVFDACSDLAVRLLAVISDDPAGVGAPR
jgi:hypothetical protein